MRVVCGVEAHLQGTLDILKADKCLKTFFQRSNTTNNDYMKEFEAYIKVTESPGIKIPIHPELIKSKLSNMEFTDAEKPTKEEKA